MGSKPVGCVPPWFLPLFLLGLPSLIDCNGDVQVKEILSPSGVASDRTVLHGSRDQTRRESDKCWPHLNPSLWSSGYGRGLRCLYSQLSERKAFSVGQVDWICQVVSQ